MQNSRIFNDLYLKNPISYFVYSIEPSVRPTTNIETLQSHLIETEQRIVEWHCQVTDPINFSL